MKQKLPIPDLVAILLSVAAYVALAYFTPRTQLYQLLFLGAVAFAAYAWLLKSSLTLKKGFWLALGFRLIFLVAYPPLSDDYFRFIWDGYLVANGENPFLHLPVYYIQAANQIAIPGINAELYNRLNSPHYFTVYPPVCQFIFGCAISVGQENYLLACLVMRLFIIAAEIGSIFIFIRLLKYLNLPEKRVWLYALNPLVIVELTGNLHFEALLIFFLLAGIYLLVKQKTMSAVVFGLAIGIKLLPLMLLPFVWRYLGFRKMLQFGIMVVGTVLLLFLPFLTSSLIQNILSSLDLYFQKFEFNAGIYYLLRWLGYQIYGYNQIQYIGPLLSLVTLAGILFVAFRLKKANIYQLTEAFLGAFTIYLLLATIVHPWYITTLVALSVLTNWRFPMLWSGLALLSYAAYQNATYDENLYLVALEYLLVFAAIFYEWRKRSIHILSPTSTD